MSISPLTRTLTATATGAVGIAAGLALSYSAIIFPSLSRVPTLRAKDKVALWSAGYDLGIYYIVPLPLLASVTFAAAAAADNAYQGGRQVFVLGAAAAFSFGHLLTTVGFMLPTNTRLKTLDARSSLSESEEKESSVLIGTWLRLHAVRVLSLSTGFVLGLKALSDHVPI